MRGSRGVGTGGLDYPLQHGKAHNNSVDLLRNTGLEPLEKHKATDVGSSSDL